MRFNFFRKRSKTQKEDDRSYNLLIKYLTSQISTPTRAEILLQESRDFLSLPIENKRLDIVRIYLAFENHCCNLDDVKKLSKKAFQKKILSRFPWLNDNKLARLAFKETNEAKLLIASFYLNQILKPIQDIAGSRKDGNIGAYNEIIDQIWNENYTNSVDLRQFKVDSNTDIVFSDMCHLSKLIFDDLSQKFGHPNIESLYHRAYGKSENLLKDHAQFPSVIQLMPIQILQQKHLRILGRTQIHKILLDQVDELEKLNKKLTREVDERKALNLVLKNRTSALEGILSNSLDAVIKINRIGMVTYWNAKAEEIFGYTVDEAEGQYLTRLIIPNEQHEDHQRGMHRYLTTGKSKIINNTLEIVAINKSGKLFPVELSVTEVKEDGETSFIGFLKDISQQKNYEATLIKAREHAEETSRFKSRFFANMSHEIRTPLNAIIGFTNLLLEQDMTEEQLDYLNLIQSSGSNLMSILNDVLEISKIEEGKLQLKPKTEKFKPTISKILAPYQAMILDKDLAYELEFEKNFPKVISLDYYRLGQILINLISNATKFTQSGGIRVYFEYDFKERDIVFIKATVSDSGKGIDQNNIDKIFESFQQEDGGIAREFGGTGLGLSISKEIASAMKGSLNVSSPSKYFKSKGSDFIVTVEGHLSEIKAKKEKQVVNGEVRDEFNNKSALLVEDNPVNQKLLSKVLEKLGLQITTAINGKVALEELAKSSFDIIFMDIQMPELDGYAATERIRELKIDTPIIAISANVYPEDIQKSLDSGMQAHIGKPFNIEELKNTIQKLI